MYRIILKLIIVCPVLSLGLPTELIGQYGFPIDKNRVCNVETLTDAYVIPLIKDNDTDTNVIKTVNNDDSTNYVPIINLENRMVPLEEFNKKYSLPENVSLKIMQIKKDNTIKNH